MIPTKPSTPWIPSKVMATNSDSIKMEEDAKAMPPPSAPTVILEAEITSLSSCLRNAVVKTGQIYNFYSDTSKLGIAKHAAHPPHALASSLGREVEKYDQLCDSIEARLLQAIAVLQRDLKREEIRLQEARDKVLASQTSSNTLSLESAQTSVPPTTDPTTIADTQGKMSQQTPRNSPPTSYQSASVGRRPSAISISSLHRPAFPLKLDLSSSTLRLSADEAALFSTGLASPVTLAPKSARPVGPNEIPPDFMAAFAEASSGADGAHMPVDIDLTVPDTSQQIPGEPMSIDVGNSADKPIELDLDGLDMSTMTDLFGDAAETTSGEVEAAVEDLFSPVIEGTNPPPATADADKTHKEEENFLNSLGVVPHASNHDIFASLVNNNPDSTPLPSKASLTAESHSAPSPGSLLASFSPSNHLGASPSNQGNLSGNDTGFDMALDLTNLSHGFFEGSQDSDMNFSMDMAALLGMTQTDENKDGMEDEKTIS